MRHRNAGSSFGRDSAHRKAMFRNIANSLFEHEMIKTTLPKAKELRRFVEPLITLAKSDSVANRRLAFDRLRDKAVVGKLFKDLGPRFKERPGGYLRILKCGFRLNDCAPMAIIELVEREGAAPAPEKPKKQKAKTTPKAAAKPKADTKPKAEAKPKTEAKPKADAKPKAEKKEDKAAE